MGTKSQLLMAKVTPQLTKSQPLMVKAKVTPQSMAKKSLTKSQLMMVKVTPQSTEKKETRRILVILKMLVPLTLKFRKLTISSTTSSTVKIPILNTAQKTKAKKTVKSTPQSMAKKVKMTRKLTTTHSQSLTFSDQPTKRSEPLWKPWAWKCETGYEEYEEGEGDAVPEDA